MWSFDLEMCGEGEVRGGNVIRVHVHARAGSRDEGNWHTLNEEAADVSPPEQLSEPWLSYLGTRLLPSSFSVGARRSNVCQENWAGVAQREPWSGGLGS